MESAREIGERTRAAVRSTFDVANGARWESADIVAALGAVLEANAHPGFRVDMVAGSGDSLRSTFRGLEGLREAWNDWIGAFERVTGSLDGFEEMGSAIVLDTTQYAEFGGSQTELENASSVVILLGEDGLIEGVEFHLDREAARDAARAYSSQP